MNYIVYKTTNLINHKIYVGIHKTEDLNDTYLGSGLVFQQALKKYGKENFEREILCVCDNVEDAMFIESVIVNKDFLQRKDVYNRALGGICYPTFSEESKQNLSEKMTQLWSTDEYKEKMNKIFNSPEFKKIRSYYAKKWIEDNPEKFQERINKINKNPEKIRKTAEKHRGMKRSEESKRKMSLAAKKHMEDPIVRKKRSGSGCIYIYNPETSVVRRHNPNDPIPDGFLKGMPKRKKKNNG